MRYANLVGFDSRAARKANLPIVIPMVVFLAPSGPILVKLPEGPYNADMETSLLSTYQLREAGIKVDDTAAHHTGFDGKMGKQAVRVDKHVIKLSIQSCLMTLSHRAPTVEEMHNLPIIDKSNVVPWSPQNHQHRGGITPFSLGNVDMVPGIEQRCFHAAASSPERQLLALLARFSGRPTYSTHVTHMLGLLWNSVRHRTMTDPLRRAATDIRRSVRLSRQRHHPKSVAFACPVLARQHTRYCLREFHPSKSFYTRAMLSPAVTLDGNACQPRTPTVPDATAPAPTPTVPATVLVPTSDGRLPDIDEYDDCVTALSEVDRMPAPDRVIQSASFCLLEDSSQFFFDAVQPSPTPRSTSVSLHFVASEVKPLPDSEVHAYLDGLDDDILLGRYLHDENASFHVEKAVDVRACLLQKQHTSALTPSMTTTIRQPDWNLLRPFFAFRPVRNIRETFARSTQLAKYVLNVPFKRHVQARNPQLNKRRLSETVATDTMFASTKGFDGARCAQVFYGTVSRCIQFYPLLTESEGGDAYEDFIREEGIPAALRRDNSAMQTGHRFRQINRRYMVDDEYTEPHHPNQNPCEMRAIRWLKTVCKLMLNKTGAPAESWSYLCRYLCALHNICADETLGYDLPVVRRHGHTPDISAFLFFRFWEPVYFANDPGTSFPANEERPGHWLGVARNSGDSLTYYVYATDTKQVLVQSTMRSALLPVEQNKRFSDELVGGFFDQYKVWARKPVMQVQPGGVPHDQQAQQATGSEELEAMPNDTIRLWSKGNDQDKEEPLLPANNANDIIKTIVPTKPIAQDDDIDNHGEPPPLPTRVAGSKKPKKPGPKAVKPRPTTRSGRQPRAPRRLVMNVFTKLVSYFSADAQRYPGEETKPTPFDDVASQSKRLDELILYHHDLDAAEEGLLGSEDHRWEVQRVLDHRLDRAEGWMMNVRWRDGNESWVTVDLMRRFAPMPAAEYADTNRLMDTWPWTRAYGRDLGIYQMSRRVYQAKASQPKYKFGAEVPRSMAHAVYLDRKNGDSLWKDAIQKDLQQINDFDTFRVPLEGEITVPEYQRIPYHMIFDVKFDGRRKARLVAEGNQVAAPTNDYYSGVVDNESVKMAFFLGARNKLRVCVADIGNAFLNALTKEKLYIVAGPEFGAMKGKELIMHKSLYGTRTACANFHDHLAAKLRSMGYTPSWADTDLWMKRVDDHFEYVACFVDDVICLSKDPMAVMKELKKDYVLKGVGTPEYYLGGDISYLGKEWNEIGCNWAMAADTYISNTVPRLETLMQCSFKEYDTPMDSNYHPEEETSALVDKDVASKYRTMTGCANWAITLGRYDVQYAVSTLARYNMAPRKGHVMALQRVYGYLKKYGKGHNVIDPNVMDESHLQTTKHPNWGEFYPDAVEELPYNKPESIGDPVHITVWVDADHARDKVSRRSVTGLLCFANGTLLRHVSRRQATVETSSYGSEIVAMRVAIDAVLDIKYKFLMLGVPVAKHATVLCDNYAVVVNVSVPSSVLKKKHLACGYHRIRESVAAKIIRVVHVPSQYNLADILTKSLDRIAFHRLLTATIFRVVGSPYPFAEIPGTQPGTLTMKLEPGIRNVTVSARHMRAREVITNTQGDFPIGSDVVIRSGTYPCTRAKVCGHPGGKRLMLDVNIETVDGSGTIQSKVRRVHVRSCSLLHNKQRSSKRKAVPQRIRSPTVQPNSLDVDHAKMRQVHGADADLFVIPIGGVLQDDDGEILPAMATSQQHGVTGNIPYASHDDMADVNMAEEDHDNITAHDSSTDDMATLIAKMAAAHIKGTSMSQEETDLFIKDINARMVQEIVRHTSAKKPG